MMIGGHTTYDSITKTTTKDADVTGIPLVQHQDHETSGILIEGEVAAAADGRRSVLFRRSTIQTRSVAAILVGAAVLLVALSTMDLGGGIGSVGSMVSWRRISIRRTDTDIILPASSQGGTDLNVHWHLGAEHYSTEEVLVEDYDYDLYDDGNDRWRDIESDIENDIILPAEELEIWRNTPPAGPADEGECNYCNYHKCRTGMPVLSDEDPQCNRGNYMCQYYTNCGKIIGNKPQPNVVIGDESQCMKCYSRGCATGRPTRSRDANVRAVCDNLHCPEYANCASEYPPAQGGNEVVWPRGKDSKSAKSEGVDEKTGKSSKGGQGASKKEGKSSKEFFARK